MNKSSRNLIVLLNQKMLSPQAIEDEMQKLHHLLYDIEKLDNIILAYEVIDLNKHKVYKKPSQLKKIFINTQSKAFVFFNCKN